MPDTQTAILLRRGAHDSTATNTTTSKLLKRLFRCRML